MARDLLSEPSFSYTFMTYGSVLCGIENTHSALCGSAPERMNFCAADPCPTHCIETRVLRKYLAPSCLSSAYLFSADISLVLAVPCPLMSKISIDGSRPCTPLSRTACPTRTDPGGQSLLKEHEDAASKTQLSRWNMIAVFPWFGQRVINSLSQRRRGQGGVTYIGPFDQGHPFATVCFPCAVAVAPYIVVNRLEDNSVARGMQSRIVACNALAHRKGSVHCHHDVIIGWHCTVYCTEWLGWSCKYPYGCWVFSKVIRVGRVLF